MFIHRSIQTFTMIKTYNDQKTKGTVQKKVIEIDKRNKEEEDGITIKLMA